MPKKGTKPKKKMWKPCTEANLAEELKKVAAGDGRGEATFHKVKGFVLKDESSEKPEKRPLVPRMKRKPKSKEEAPPTIVDSNTEKKRWSSKLTTLDLDIMR